MGRVSMSDNRHSVNLEVPAGRARGLALARTSSVQASTRLCTRAHPRARVHVPRARMHNGMHACKDTCTFAASTCWLAVRCACVHEHVQASRPACIHVVSPLTCVSACSRFDCLQLVWPVSFPAVDNRISVDDDLIVIFTVLARVLTKSARNENSWLELHEAGLK